MRRSNYTTRRTLFFSSILFLCIGILIGLGTNLFVATTFSGFFIRDQPQLSSELLVLLNQTNGEEITKTMLLPAIDQEGNGVLSNLTVYVRKGSGLVLVSINDVLADYSTQYSAREAALAAARHTNINISEYDLIYHIQSNTAGTQLSLIGGPSAGAAMAVTTVAALENQRLPDTILITGTIDAEGNIGEVGGIFAKAQLAKELGIRTFLVPPRQSTETFYREEDVCHDTRFGEYCERTIVPFRVNIAERLKINIHEVATLSQALRFFF